MNCIHFPASLRPLTPSKTGCFKPSALWQLRYGITGGFVDLAPEQGCECCCWCWQIGLSSGYLLPLSCIFLPIVPQIYAVGVCV
jgi:hypothetical protein